MHADQAIHALIDEIEGVLTQFSPEQYREPLPAYNGSSIGQHFRHILEFFQCLEASFSTGIVDYAARVRNLIFEQDPAAALAAFQQFSSSITAANDHLPLQLKGEFFSDIRPVYPSSLGRELVFVYDHAIHHLAIIQIGIRCYFPGIVTPENFGVSPSTIKANQIKTA